MSVVNSSLPASVKKVALSIETRANVRYIFPYLEKTVNALSHSRFADVFTDEDEFARKDPWFNVFTTLGGYVVSLHLLSDKRAKHVENVDLAHRWIRAGLSALLCSNFYESSLTKAKEDGDHLSHGQWVIPLVDRILESIHKTTAGNVRRFDPLALMYHDLFALSALNLFTRGRAIEGNPNAKALIRRILIEDPYGLGALIADLAREPEKLQMPYSFAASVGLFSAYLQGHVDFESLVDVFKRAFEQENHFIPFFVGVVAEKPERLPTDWDMLLRRVPRLSDFLTFWQQNQRKEISAVGDFYEQIHPTKKSSRALSKSSLGMSEHDTIKMKRRLGDFALALIENRPNLDPEIEAFIAYAKENHSIDFATALLFDLDTFAKEALSAGTPKPELWALISIWNEREMYLSYSAEKTVGKDYYVPILFDSKSGYMLVKKHGLGYRENPSGSRAILPTSPASACIPRVIVPSSLESFDLEVLLDRRSYDDRDFAEDPEAAISNVQRALKSFREPPRLLLARYRQISPVRPLYQLMDYRQIELAHHHKRNRYALSS